VAPGNALTKPIDLSKGIMMTFGHSYIGRPAMRVKDADTTDEWNDYTKVKLDPYKLRDQGTQQYPVGDRDEPEEEEAVELIAPTAKFIVDSIAFLSEPLSYLVEFDDISTPGDGLLDSSRNIWDTGDGSIIEGGAPLQYTYDVDGDYTVKLTVTDTNDLSNDYSMDITIDPPEDPIASFEVGPIEGLVVSFTDTSAPGDGPINEWNWDFGDNSGTSTNQFPTYEYTQPGTYTVTLTVTDIYELSNTTEPGITITVP
jgi:PKD repeat protein